MKTDDLIQVIQSLPVDERARLADCVLRSLNQTLPAIDQKWAELASQRLMLANFHPDAQAELNHAIDDYEANQPSLGYQFAIEIFAAAVLHLHRESGYWSERA
jgi:hypothetical protein